MYGEKFKMNKLIISLIIVLLFISSCTKEETKDILTPPEIPSEESQTLKGITLTPKSFNSDDFTDFFSKAKQTGQIITWSGDWNELSNTKNGGPTVLAELSKQYNFIPLVIAQFFTQSSGKLLRPLDEVTKNNYKNSAVAFVGKYKPKYFGLGIEVNILYEKSPADFENFVSLYSEVYNAIKAVSPNTKVFTVFQLEKIKGLNGGLFGGVNDINKAQWFLIDKFQSDIVAFTTYPGLIYKNPTEIPEDYHEEIKLHTNKPIAFTEIGWHSKPSPTGWESSEQEQAEFISKFFSLTNNLNKEFLVYSFMFDQNTIEPFNSMGLYNKDNSKKQAIDEWARY